MGHRLRDVVDHGIPMLLVDHDMGLVLRICDQLVVVESGRVKNQRAAATLDELIWSPPPSRKKKT